MGICQSVEQTTEIVNINSGPIRGRVYIVKDDFVCDAFMGIPYAEPPIGKLRFKKSEPIKKWSSVRDCTWFGPRCPQDDQYIMYFANLVGKSEANCLTINVFAPREPSTEFGKRRPVLVYIHGGGFAIHSSSNYGDEELCRNLCTKDVVVVTFNYRLGTFGFFTTGDEVCRGNMGTWDQILALRWVQENISEFGGDPSNVTILGQSAGAVSCDILTMTPYSKGLFKRIVPMSGSTYIYFGERDVRSMKDQAVYCKRFARSIGWKNPDENDSEDLMQFMQKQSTSTLSTCLQNTRKCIFHGGILFQPCYDGDLFPHHQTVARDLINPKVEVLCGITRCEGLFFFSLFRYGRSVSAMKWFLDQAYTSDRYSDTTEVKKRIFEFYTNDIDVENKEAITRRFIDLLSDCLVNNGMLRYVQEMSSRGHTVYFYQFDYCNQRAFGWFYYLMPFLDATHTSEVRYVLGKGVISKFKPSRNDLKMLEMMTTYVTNFAKYGNPHTSSVPHPEWKPYDPSKPFQYFSIGLEPEMKDDYQGKRVEFWNQLLTEFDPSITEDMRLPL